jgi:hypothetical protein
MADFSIKRNDRRPYIRMSLGYDDGSAANLAFATGVRFLMRECKTGKLKVSAAAIVVDAETGLVEYQWAVGDTNTPGKYDVEWEVTWGDGKPQTFPGEGYNTVEVTADLGP